MKTKPSKDATKKTEPERKRDHNSRILNVEQASFTPLVFFITGGMGRNSSMFVKRLCPLNVHHVQNSMQNYLCIGK